MPEISKRSLSSNRVIPRRIGLFSPDYPQPGADLVTLHTAAADEDQTEHE